MAAPAEDLTAQTCDASMSTVATASDTNALEGRHGAAQWRRADVHNGAAQWQRVDVHSGDGKACVAATAEDPATGPDTSMSSVSTATFEASLPASSSDSLSEDSGDAQLEIRRFLEDEAPKGGEQRLERGTHSGSVRRTPTSDGKASSSDGKCDGKAQSSQRCLKEPRPAAPPRENRLQAHRHTSLPLLAHSGLQQPSLRHCPSVDNLHRLRRESIEACLLFTGLRPKAFSALVAVVTLQDPLPDGAEIFRTGHDGSEMYFVVTGEVEIRRDGALLTTVTQGGFFGEIGVLFAGNRTADAFVPCRQREEVGAKGPCRLAKLHRTDLEKVAKDCGFRDQLYAQGQSLPSVRSWFVARLPLFAHCASEPGFLSAVAGALQVRTSCAKDVMVRQGEPGNEMLFLFEGTVSIIKSGGRSGRPLQLAAPNFFGELALLFSEPRSATVACESNCRFYVLGRQALHEIMQQFPRVIGMVYSTAQEASNLKAHFIKKIPMFKSMLHDEEFVANAQLALKSFSAAPGEHLVRQGATSDGRMYAIAHGHAEVRKAKKAGEPPQTVATLNAGSIFGEVALLLDTPRVASVVAVGHCHVYTLSRDAFETLAVVYDSWWRELTSERGVLLKQLESTGVAIGADATTHTHGLRIPQLAGTTVSSMLSAAEAPVPSAAPAAPAVPEGRLCLVCRTNEKNMLSVPCGHISACEHCHEILRACPLCRTAIQQGMKAYF